MAVTATTPPPASSRKTSPRRRPWSSTRRAANSGVGCASFVQSLRKLRTGRADSVLLARARDAVLLHLVNQRAARDAELGRGARLVAARVGERLHDRLPFRLAEARGQIRGLLGQRGRRWARA